MPKSAYLNDAQAIAHAKYLALAQLQTQAAMLAEFYGDDERGDIEAIVDSIIGAKSRASRDFHYFTAVGVYTEGRE